MIRARALASLAATGAKQAQGKAALLVHGAGGGGWEYELWRDAFEQRGWRVVARDLQPGASGLAATSVDDYVGQLAQWLPPAERSSELVIVGASMGGALALRAAATLRPTALVLVNSVVPRPWAHRATTKPVPDVLRWAGSSLERTARAMPDATPEVQRWACAQWRDESGAVMRALRGGYEAGKPDCRCLFVISAEDTDVPPAEQRAWAAAWGAAALELPGASHVGPLLGRAAPGVARRVVGWLEREVDHREEGGATSLHSS